MKKLLSFLLAFMLIVLVVPMGAFSFTASAGGGMYSYTVSNGEATITYATLISGKTTIPSKMGGYLVTRIGNSAFADCNNLTSITISDSVTSIGDYAFSSCDSLTSVTIPDSVTSIGYGAFGHCDSLTSVYITDIAAWCNVDFGDASANPLYYADNLYLNGKLVTDVVIPDGVTQIPYHAFSCNSLTSVTIPNSVTNIGSYAFSDCTKLTSVTIGNSVTSIGDYAFLGCESLASITIPNSVISIGNGAFCGCDSLTSVTIPNSVTNIGSYAFSDCTKLTSVTIGNSVTSIGDYAFECCTSLTDVWYKGSETDKSNISIGGSNSYLLNVTWHYNTCDSDKHLYDNTCDTTCNKCDATRVPDVHKVEITTNVITLQNDSKYPFKYSDDVYASTNKSHNSSSSFIITAVYDYELTLQYSVSSESNYDKLIIYKNSTALDTISGTVTNRTKTISLKAGDTVKITYSKDNSQSNGRDCGSFKITSTTDLWVPADTVEHLCDEAVICDVCGEIVVEAIDHTYDNTCDTVCNVCNSIREITHTYDNEYDYTCNVCKFSRAPHAPTLNNKYSGTIVLNAIDGIEYSIDGGVTWQDGNVFSGLVENTEYSFVQRVKELDTAMQSEASDAFIVYLKASQTTPAAPLALSFTDTMITLLPVSGCEYSIDGLNWQQSHVFRELLPSTQYVMHQRLVATETAEASASSTVKVTTDKSVQGNVPPAPTMASHTSNSITLNTVEGCEYSIDGKKWQASATFTRLSCGTEYTFYQRYKEDADSYASKSSAGAVIKTDKGTKQPPSAPTLAEKTHNSIALVEYDGYEYSLDTVNWQTSPIFTGLNPSTNYVFFRRYAENDRYYASAASTYLTVRTNETPQCAIDGEHIYDNICDADCNYCGELRENCHVYDNDCDDNCNECGATRTSGGHVYTNKCDPACNVCGKERVVSPHVYTNSCDKDCNECGDIREVVDHVYDNACDATCNVCLVSRAVPEHVYNNNCDVDCNVCGAYRVPSEHVYNNACDTNCNECGDTRDVPEHVFTSSCDVSCNECGYIRDAQPHTYSNDCDNFCNICDFERAVAGHKYDNNCDDICNECGSVRIIPGHIYDNNCDTDCNECGKVRIPYDHVYDNNCDADCNECGLERIPATHTYSNGCDNDCNECGAERAPYILGDANGDGKISGKDYALVLQSINGWDVAINMDAADVTGDGKISGKDYSLLLQYINGWDVELK